MAKFPQLLRRERGGVPPHPPKYVCMYVCRYVCRVGFPAPMEGRRSIENKGVSPITWPGSDDVIASAKAQSLMVMGALRCARGALDRANRELDGQLTRGSVKGRSLKVASLCCETQKFPSEVAFSIRSMLTVNMKNIKSLSALLVLQLAVLPCFARSGRRANPPALEDLSLPGNFNGLNGSVYVLLTPVFDFVD